MAKQNPKQQSPKIPAVLVLLRSQIKRGDLPDPEVLEAVNDEIDQQQLLDLTLLILETVAVQPTPSVQPVQPQANIATGAPYVAPKVGKTPQQIQAENMAIHQLKQQLTDAPNTKANARTAMRMGTSKVSR